jgi:tRNA (cytidine/uridine-2'-O-)-methyltransferase
MKIILNAPEIPQNVGSIARTCAVTGTHLVLVRPLGFNLSDRQVKRAGLDYWEDLTISTVDFLEMALENPFYFFSTKGKKIYTAIQYEEDASLVFGSESAGLPRWVHERWPERIYTIPMGPKMRSLNLSNAAAIVLYEALRQMNFRGLQKPSDEGHRDLSIQPLF